MIGVRGDVCDFLRMFAGLHSFEFKTTVAQNNEDQTYDGLFYVRDTLARHAQNTLKEFKIRYTGAKVNDTGSLTALKVLQRLEADWGSLIPARSFRKSELLDALPMSIHKITLFFDKRYDLVKERGRIDHLIPAKISRLPSLSTFNLTHLTEDAYSIIIANSLRKDSWFRADSRPQIPPR